jgi:hypothetical protein
MRRLVGLIAKCAVNRVAYTSALLRVSELENSYADAWASWGSSADAEAWESAAADGIAS